MRRLEGVPDEKALRGGSILMPGCRRAEQEEKQQQQDHRHHRHKIDQAVERLKAAVEHQGHAPSCPGKGGETSAAPRVRLRS
jgi:hypothetical protein